MLKGVLRPALFLLLHLGTLPSSLLPPEIPSRLEAEAVLRYPYRRLGLVETPAIVVHVIQHVVDLIGKSLGLTI